MMSSASDLVATLRNHITNGDRADFVENLFSALQNKQRPERNQSLEETVNKDALNFARQCWDNLRLGQSELGAALKKVNTPHKPEDRAFIRENIAVIMPRLPSSLSKKETTELFSEKEIAELFLFWLQCASCFKFDAIWKVACVFREFWTGLYDANSFQRLNEVAMWCLSDPIKGFVHIRSMVRMISWRASELSDHRMSWKGEYPELYALWVAEMPRRFKVSPSISFTRKLGLARALEDGDYRTKAVDVLWNLVKDANLSDAELSGLNESNWNVQISMLSSERQSGDQIPTLPSHITCDSLLKSSHKLWGAFQKVFEHLAKGEQRKKDFMIEQVEVPPEPARPRDRMEVVLWTRNSIKENKRVLFDSLLCLYMCENPKEDEDPRCVKAILDFKQQDKHLLIEKWHTSSMLSMATPQEFNEVFNPQQGGSFKLDEKFAKVLHLFYCDKEEYNFTEMQQASVTSKKLVMLNSEQESLDELFNDVNQQRRDKERSQIGFPHCGLELVCKMPLEQVNLFQERITKEQFGVSFDVIDVVYKLAGNGDRNGLLSFYEKMDPLYTIQNGDIVSRRYSAPSQITTLNSFRTVFNVLDALLSSRNENYPQVAKKLKEIFGNKDDEELASTFAFNLDNVVKNKSELLSWFKQADTGKVDVSAQTKLLAEYFEKVVIVNFSRNPQGELEIWDKKPETGAEHHGQDVNGNGGALIMSQQQIQDSVVSCETAITTDGIGQTREDQEGSDGSNKTFKAIKEKFEKFVLMQHLLADMREMRFPEFGIQSGIFVCIGDVENKLKKSQEENSVECLRRHQASWNDICKMKDMRLWLTLAQLSWLYTLLQSEKVERDRDITKMLETFCDVNEDVNVGKCVSSILNVSSDNRFDTLFNRLTDLNQQNKKESSSVQVNSTSSLFKKKAGQPDQVFWDKMAQIDQTRRYETLPSLVFECSSSTSAQEVLHFIQRVDHFCSSHQFFMLHAERLQPYVKDTLKNTIETGELKAIVMISGNDPIEELFQTVEALPEIVDDSIPEQSCRVYEGEKLGFEVFVVTGKASSGKTTYINSTIVDKGECLVIPVNEAFSLKRLEERSSQVPRFVHFKVTPFCDIALFNEFVRVLLASNVIYDRQKGSCMFTQFPKETALIFELEQGENRALKFGIGSIPALGFIKSSQIPPKEGDRLTLLGFTAQYPSVQKANKKWFCKQKEFPNEWAYRKTFGSCTFTDEVDKDAPMKKMWNALCVEFNVDMKDVLRAENTIEKKHFVMNQTSALRLLYLNGCVKSNYPVLLVGDTGTGKSELARVLSIFLNMNSCSNYYLSHLKEFLRDKGVSECENIKTVDEMMKHVREYCGKNRETAEEFAVELFAFLEKENKRGFYHMKSDTLKGGADGYKRRYTESGQIDFMISDLKEYAETTPNFYKSIAMDTHITVADLERDINEIKETIKNICGRGFGGDANAQGTSRFRFVWFIDECTSTNLMGVIKELIVDHSFNGAPLPQQLVVIGAYNKNDLNASQQRVPYTEYVVSDKNTASQMMEFSVRPPPQSFKRYERPVVFDFQGAQLEEFVRRLLDNASFDDTIRHASFYQNETSDKKGDNFFRYKEFSVLWLSTAFEVYQTSKYLRVHASIRDIARSVRFTLHFVRHFNLFKLDKILVKAQNMIQDYGNYQAPGPFELCLLLSVYLCYYLRVPVDQLGSGEINRGSFFGEFCGRLKPKLEPKPKDEHESKEKTEFDGNPRLKPKPEPEDEHESKVEAENSKNHHLKSKPEPKEQFGTMVEDVFKDQKLFLNTLLTFTETIFSCATDQVFSMTKDFRDKDVKDIDLFKENVFALVCCIHARVPVVIFGPPGCSKTLSWNVVKKCFGGGAGGPELFQQTIVHSFPLQCSTQTTDADVKQAFSRLSDERKNAVQTPGKSVAYVLFLDEASLVDNEEAPLKTLHQQLDFSITSTDDDAQRTLCVVLSNSVPDAAKTNRMVLVAQSSLDNGACSYDRNRLQLAKFYSDDKNHDKSPDDKKHDKSPDDKNHDKSPDDKNHDKSPDDKSHDKLADDKNRDKSPDDKNRDKSPDDKNHDKSPDDKNHDKSPDDKNRDGLAEKLADILWKCNELFAKENPKWHKSFYQLRDFVYAMAEINAIQARPFNFKQLFCVLCRQFGGMKAGRYIELINGLCGPEPNKIPITEPERELDVDGENRASIWMMREMVRLITNGPRLVPSPTSCGGKRFLLVIDDTECGAALPFIRILLDSHRAEQGAALPFVYVLLNTLETQQSSLVECSVTDFAADSQDRIHQNAIYAMARGMQQGKTVVVTHLVPVSPAFFTVLNLEHESSKTQVHFANIAIGPILRPYPVDKNFSVLVHMTRSEMDTAPTALMNRFQKVLFTFDDLFNHLKCVLQWKAYREWNIEWDNEFLSVEICRKKCNDLVEKCGKACFFGFLPNSTISSILFASLTREGSFQCPLPYDIKPSITTQRIADANVQNALEMLLLVARPDILRFTLIDSSLRRAFDSQVHTNVVDFIKNLKSHKQSSWIRWNVFTEKSKEFDSLKLFEKKLADAGLNASVVSLVCDSKEKFEEQVKNAFKEQLDGSTKGQTNEDSDDKDARFVVCIADMERTSSHNIIFARALLDKYKRLCLLNGREDVDDSAKVLTSLFGDCVDGTQSAGSQTELHKMVCKRIKNMDNVFVVLVQLFTKRQVSVTEPHCSAVFTKEWRCSFVSTLFDDAENRDCSGSNMAVSPLQQSVIHSETELKDISRILRLRERYLTQFATRLVILRQNCVNVGNVSSVMSDYTRSLDETLRTCTENPKLQVLFLTLAQIWHPSLTVLNGFATSDNVKVWCNGFLQQLMVFSGVEQDDPSARKKIGPLSKVLCCSEWEYDATAETEPLEMKDLLMRILSVFDLNTIKSTIKSLSDHKELPTSFHFTPKHCLALLNFALRSPKSKVLHLDTVLTYCRKSNIPVPEKDTDVTMEQLTQLAVLFCNHSILCRRIEPPDYETLGGVASELRNIMLRMAVDGRDINVDARLSEAKSALRLPMAEKENDWIEQRRCYHLLIDSFVEYLMTLRNEPNTAIVLPQFLYSLIFMELPRSPCPFCPKQEQ